RAASASSAACWGPAPMRTHSPWTSRRSRRVSEPCARARSSCVPTMSRCSARHSRCTPKYRDRMSALRDLVDGLTFGAVARTVVDVALVYYLIYRLLLTIRGTRAAQMIVGVVLIGAIFFVAERV